MDEDTNIDLYNFLGAIDSNVPIASYVTPKLLETKVFAIVGEGSTPPRYLFARHHFHHPEILDLQRPSVLVFPTLQEAQDYVDSSGIAQLEVGEISIRDLFNIVSFNFGKSLGVMFRVDGNDRYANPALIEDFTIYAKLGGLTLLAQEDISIEQEAFTSLSAEQYEQLCDLLNESEDIKSYKIYGGQVDGVHTTVVDVYVKDDVKFEQAAALHSNLLGRCQAIASDVTLLVKPEPIYNELPGFNR